MNKLSLIALCTTLSLSAACVTAPADATTPFVIANGPARATVVDFKKGSLAVTVTCRRECHATVFATIRASVAKQLGFPGVKGKFVLVGTGAKDLKAHTPTKISVVPTSAAKHHLTTSVEIVGSAKGVPTGTTAPTNYFAGWYAKLG